MSEIDDLRFEAANLRGQRDVLNGDLRNALDRCRLLRSFIQRIGGFCASTYRFPRIGRKDGRIIEEGGTYADILAWQKEALQADDALAAEVRRIPLDEFMDLVRADIPEAHPESPFGG